MPLAFAAAITGGFVLIGDTWWQMFTAVGFAVLFTQTAFLGHDAAHRQIFRSGGRWNDWVSLVIGDLFIGMSYEWWQHKHTRHHANPNQIGRDPRHRTADRRGRARAGGGRARTPFTRWVMAHQGVFFFPILLLEGGLSLHASSVRRVFSRDPVAHRRVEIGFLMVRLGGFVALVFLVLAPEKAVVFLAIELGLFGVYMGDVVRAEPQGMPIVPRDAKLDFLTHQVLMSRNIGGGRFVDVLMGGLNHQIEHHLFPSMPRPHLRIAAPMIEEYCREVGVPFTRTSLWRSYGIVLHYINRAGLGRRDPFECPLLEQRLVGGAVAPGEGSLSLSKRWVAEPVEALVR